MGVRRMEVVIKADVVSETDNGLQIVESEKGM